MKRPEEVLAQIQNEQSPEYRLQQAEKTVAHLERQLRDALRVIDVLVAVGKLKQGHVEEARALVNTLSD